MLWLPVPDRPGPLAHYVSPSLIGCPLDPAVQRPGPPRSSFEWNYSLAGHRVNDVSMKPLVWFRGPWTEGGRWVGYLWTEAGKEGQARQWVPEGDVAEMRRTGKLPDPPAKLIRTAERKALKKVWPFE